MSEASYYIRFRGKVLGPFEAPEVESLARRGQLTRFHEVTADRRDWTPGDRWCSPSGAAPPAPMPAPPPPPTARPAPPPGRPAEPADWSYDRLGQADGPHPLSHLLDLVAAGEIGPSTRVWRDGMDSWAPLNQVVDLPGRVPARQASAADGINLHIDLGGHAGRAGPAPLPYPYPAAPVSGLAIASLVLGLLPLYGLGSLLATIFGSVALSQIQKSRGSIGGRGMATAGLVLGVLGLCVFVLVVVQPDVLLSLADLLRDIAIAIKRRQH